jgi:hypothetical protein
MLDHYLENRIRTSQFKDSAMIYLHYSDKEHTYPEHIVHLLAELRDNNVKVVQDVADYTNHSDISFYFPDFLSKTVKTLVS